MTRDESRRCDSKERHVARTQCRAKYPCCPLIDKQIGDIKFKWLFSKYDDLTRWNNSDYFLFVCNVYVCCPIGVVTGVVDECAHAGICSESRKHGVVGAAWSVPRNGECALSTLFSKVNSVLSYFLDNSLTFGFRGNL